MMYALYTFLYALGLCAYAPRTLWALLRGGRYAEGLGQRLGHVPPELEQIEPGAIWIHAVSVGEVHAARGLLRHLRQILPDVPMLLSTTTSTGQSLAARSGAEAHFYCPLDLPHAIAAYLDHLQPRALLLVETEIWPNMIRACAARSIPVAVVNGRLSAGSLSRYRWLGQWWRSIVAQLAVVCARTPREAARFCALGVPSERVFATGNLKADAAVLASPIETRQALAEVLHLEAGTELLIAGCTMPGEEEVVLQAYAKTRQACPDVRLLLAPRHPERFDQVANAAATAGWRCHRRTDEGPDGAEVLLLDTIGELPVAYGLGAASFVGGSLVPTGGHNLLEPAVYGQPVLFGPHVENFAALAEEFLGAGAAWVVNDADELAEAWTTLLKDDRRREDMGTRAREVAFRDANAGQRTARVLLPFLT
jgi:3-deoxy-D-manno-octulosonic-acid transferase